MVMKYVERANDDLSLRYPRWKKDRRPIVQLNQIVEFSSCVTRWMLKTTILFPAG